MNLERYFILEKEEQFDVVICVVNSLFGVDFSKENGMENEVGLCL